MVLGEFQRQVRGHPCISFMCVLHLGCIDGYIVFSKLLKYIKLHCPEVSQDIWFVCVQPHDSVTV